MVEFLSFAGKGLNLPGTKVNLTELESSQLLHLSADFFL